MFAFIAGRGYSFPPLEGAECSNYGGPERIRTDRGHIPLLGSLYAIDGRDGLFDTADARQIHQDNLVHGFATTKIWNYQHVSALPKLILIAISI